MKERDWRTLIHTIQNKNCILVLGPDVAQQLNEDTSTPLTEVLSNELASEVERERKVLNRNNLAHTAQLYAEMTSENDLRLDTASFFQACTSTSNIYDNLAAIPFHLVVNAAPDKLLIKALEKANKTFDVDWYNYRGNKRDMVKWNARENPLIYYLYGSPDEPESLVVSEKHLLEFLIAVISKEPAIQSNVMSEFRNKEKSFLFIGFGFRNWYLRILLYVMLGGKESQTEKAGRSFAFEEIVPEDQTELQQICILFNKKLKIDFSDLEISEFLGELRSRYEAQASTYQNGAASHEEEEQLAPDAPSIFLCHASEDKDATLELYNELRAHGLNPWIDKEGIRGGDDWNRLLERTIRDVDYFVVVQSEALKSKTVGYVNKEIKLALERQQEYRFGIKFIIPVKIDDSEILEDLDFIQTVDLSDRNNITQLVKSIRRDQERRKK